MLQTCTDNLEEIKSLLLSINDTQYTEKIEMLSGASIGQHVRHVIELYQRLIIGFENAEVNYDLRKRDVRIETDTEFALKCIEEIILFINSCKHDKNLVLKGNFSKDSDQTISIHTSLYRELTYNLEHCIHHQALIKIALKVLANESLIDANFGVASATVRYKRSVS